MRWKHSAWIATAVTLAATLSGVAIAGPYPFSEKARLAWVLLGRREYQRALSVSEAAVAERPGDPVALAVRGTAYQDLGEFDRAMADHDAVLKITPDDPGALTNSCWVRAVANVQLELALSYCDRAVAGSHSQQFTAYDTRGFLHLRRGEYAQAVADYGAALELRRKIPSSMYGRGLAELRLGNEVAGRADIAAATKLEPSVVDDFAGKGLKP